ncbi:RNA polymerase sigma factor [Paenibacillus sp. GCM10012303]|uniref:RNA polymerase sigma factor n=1 Tax=Paenibacillus sp. GCM10012303 TaxID=3317340 RepID=UPI0036D36391
MIVIATENINLDHQLINSFITLESKDQKIIFTEFKKLVYPTIASILKDQMLIEDAIQEAFYKIIKVSSSIQHSTNFKGWLIKVTKNTAFDMLRSRKKRRSINFSSISKISKEENSNSLILEPIDILVENKIRNEILMSSLNDLKDDYKTVLILYYVKGFSYHEISNELGITINVLRQRLARARKKLASNFASRWNIKS